MSDMNSQRMPRPQSVGRFELLAWLSIALIVVDVAAYIILYPGKFFSDDGAPVNAIEVTAGIVMIVSLLASPALIFAAARRRQNWARWFYGVLVAMTTASFAVSVFFPMDEFASADLVLSVLSSAAEIAAVYFVFSRDSAAWFGHPAPDAPLAA